MVKNIFEQVSIAVAFLVLLSFAIFGLQVSGRFDIDKIDKEANITKVIDTVLLESNSKVSIPTFPSAIVTKVVDGDTIHIKTILDQSSQDLGFKLNNQSSGDTSYVVRLIGINTPETVDPRKEVECFGREASKIALEKLLNKEIRLEFDLSQDRYDRYGRLLAYVFVGDNSEEILFNKYLIEEGYAYEYTYESPYKYQFDFKAAQKEAEENKKGLWSDLSVGGCK